MTPTEITLLCCFMFYLGVTYARSKMDMYSPNDRRKYAPDKITFHAPRTEEEVAAEDYIIEEPEFPAYPNEGDFEYYNGGRGEAIEWAVDGVRPIEENDTPISGAEFEKFKEARRIHRRKHNITEKGDPRDLFFSDWQQKNKS
jgi:hypothetical protein